jgi:hypothetical protein
LATTFVTTHYNGEDVQMETRLGNSSLPAMAKQTNKQNSAEPAACSARRRARHEDAASARGASSDVRPLILVLRRGLPAREEVRGRRRERRGAVEDRTGALVRRDRLQRAERVRRRAGLGRSHGAGWHHVLLHAVSKAHTKRMRTRRQHCTSNAPCQAGHHQPRL